MKLDYFNGTNQIDVNDSIEILNACIESNSYQYLSLLTKYFDKNNAGIAQGINYHSPLLTLLSQPFVNAEWVQLYFKLSEMSQVTLDGSVFTDATLMCRQNDELNHLEDYITWS